MKIVLVDSSRVVVMAMRGLLAEHGHAVVGFHDGPEALAYIAAHADVDVLMTSLVLPSMSGFELCWETRLLASKTRPIYVVAMSSDKERERLAEALDSGADDFIGRPPKPEELLARLRAAERISLAHRELVRLAMRDPLTDLLNRRAFLEAAEVSLVTRSFRSPPSLMMVDVDRFKLINDTWGHDVGDRVIRSVASVLASSHAIVGRLGGEEFALLTPGGSLGDAMALAETLRRTIEVTPVDTPLGPVSCTASVGLVALRHRETLDEALKRADMALYAAKEGGRNRIVNVDEIEGDLMAVEAPRSPRTMVG